ncbi:MAG: hypothetical protein AAF797_12165 [Planctomycetota bacterium]
MRSLLALMLLAVFTGCSATPDAATPQTQRAITPVPADQYHATLAAARTVLTDLGYTLDRDDHRFGILTTRPLDAATLAEVWRPDNRSAGLAAESTLSEIRRTVRVTLTPLTRSNPPTHFALAVEVELARKHAPLRYLNGSARTVFATLDDLPTEWEARGLEPEYWQPVRRDATLEAHLTERILDRLANMS